MLERLNSDLSLMGEKIPQMMENSSNSRLRSLRMSAIKMMKKELHYAVENLNQVTSRLNSFLFDMKTLLDKMNSEEIQEDEWNNLIHDIRVGYSPQKMKTWPNVDRDFKFRCAIRHGLDLLFKEHTPLPDELNSAIEKINEIESLDYQNVHNILLSLCYHADETITPEYIQQFLPAIALLKEKNLLSKINFLRLILCNYPEAHDIGHNQRTTLYDWYGSAFYQRSPAEPETTLAFIKLMTDLDILTQKNLELLFKVIALEIGRRKDNSLELVLERFTNTCVSGNVDNHNDLFETFMNKWYQNRSALNDEESLIAGFTDSDPVEQARILSATRYLNNLRTQLTQRLEIEGDAVEEEKNSFVKYCGQLTNKVENVENIFKYMPSLTKMTANLLRDNIHTDLNLQQLLRFADKSASIFAAYELLRETKTFDTPQQAFDILIETAKFVDSTAQMILWLYRELRTPKMIRLILINASYVPDLLAVCRFEFGVYSFSKESATCVEVAEIIFMKNMTEKMEYLSSLRKIYEFITLYKVGHLSDLYIRLESRLKFVASIAAGLEAGTKDSMTNGEAYEVYSRADSYALETSTKDPDTSPSINTTRSNVSGYHYGLFPVAVDLSSSSSSSIPDEKSERKYTI
jgi:hypothetical protein